MNPASNPLVTNLLCGAGILLAILAGTWPLLGKLFSRRDRSKAAVADSLTPQAQKAKASAIALALRPFSHRTKAFFDLLWENLLLREEVNSHRRFRGLPDLPGGPLTQ